MPDLDQERIPPQKTERWRTRERTLRILQSVPNSEEVAALTPGAGDDEARTRDKFEGATAAAIAASSATRGVENVEALVTGVNPRTVAHSSTIFVQGYYVAGDGGGGVFRVVMAASGAEDGGTFFVSDIDSDYAWERVLPGHVTPQMFGAVADGVADDTEAVQGALDKAAESVGEVVMSAGNYRVTAQIEVGSNTTIRASGAWLVRDFQSATFPDNFSRALLRNKTFATPTFSGPANTSVPERVTNVSIYGLGVKTSAAAYTGPGIAFGGVHNLILDGVTVLRSYNAWAITLFAKNARVSNCAVLENQALYEDGIHVIGGEQITITNCNIRSGDDSIAFGCDGADCFLRDVTVSNCSVNSNRAFGIKFFADAFQTAGVTNIERVNVSGIVGQSGYLRNGGVFIKEYGTPRGAIRNCRISGVRLDVNGAGASHDGVNPYGVFVDGGTDLVFDDVAISGNRTHAFYASNLRGPVTITRSKLSAAVSGSAFYGLQNQNGSVGIRQCELSSTDAFSPAIRDYETDLALSGSRVQTANTYWVAVSQDTSSTRSLEVSGNTFVGSGTTAVGSVGPSATLLRFLFLGNACPANVTVEAALLASTSIIRAGNSGTSTSDLGSRVFGRQAVMLTGSTTHDLGNLSPGSSETFTVAVPGAAVGDFAIVSYPGFASSLVFQCWISGADTVSVRAVNAGSGSYDHGSSSYTVTVFKR